MSAREELAVEVGYQLGCVREHTPTGDMCGAHFYGWLSTGECPTQERVTDALLASPVLASLQAEALAPVAAWLADGIGFPLEVAMPDTQPPAALWEAVVDHIHTDTTGSWHGNQLTREDTDSWLRDEAGMPDPTPAP